MHMEKCCSMVLMVSMSNVTFPRSVELNNL